MVSTRWRSVPHSSWNNRVIENQVRWTNYCKEWTCQLVTSFVRFNAFRLLPLGLREVTGLCQQASVFGRSTNQHWTRNSSNIAGFMRKSDGKLRPTAVLMPQITLWTFEWYPIPYIMVLIVLHADNKISMIIITVLVLFKKQIPSPLLKHPLLFFHSP